MGPLYKKWIYDMREHLMDGTICSRIQLCDEKIKQKKCTKINNTPTVSSRHILRKYCLPYVSRVAQSVQCLTTDWTAGVRSPTEAQDLSSNICIQTGSGAHPTSYTMGTGGSFPGVKRGRGVMLTTHPLLVPRLRKSRSYTSCHPKRLHGV
jgi:hypothetical protein